MKNQALSTFLASINFLGDRERGTGGVKAGRGFSPETDVLQQLGKLQRPGDVVTGVLADRRVGRPHLGQHPVMRQAFDTVAAAQPINRNLSIASVDFQREEVFPFRAAHVEERRLPTRRSQGEERVVVNRHIPEVRGRDPVNVGKRPSKKPAGQIDQVHSLIDELSSTGLLRVGSPLPLVSNAATMSVAASDKHQRPELARVHKRPRLSQRRVIAMVEPNPYATVVLSCGVNQLIQFGHRPRAGFFNQHVLTGFDGRHTDPGQPVVRCCNEHDVHVGADNGIFPARDGRCTGVSCGKFNGASGHRVGACHKSCVGERRGSLFANPPASDDGNSGSGIQRSPHVKPRSFGIIRRKV